MRITNRMLSNNAIRNINRNLENMARAQEQMSSGKRVNRPSDDPIVVARILAFKTSIAANDQYQKNMEDAKGWVDASESALGMATDVLQRARELAVYGANGTMPLESMQALGKEVDQLKDEMKQIANTSYGGRYLFGGSKTTEAPFGDDLVYKGDEANLEWEIAPRVKIAVNENGKETFVDAIDTGSGSKKGIFDLLSELSNALNKGDYSGVEGTLSQFDQAIDHILDIRASLGAMSNRLEMSLSRLSDTQISLTQTMSKLEDVDLAKATIEYKNYENVYLASLATSAKALQPSLIDYLS
ncbi:flagellar hook-associated protein FlgL [Neomoorella thermoacetica]|uniref:flagellar hook-associated protein FlgL n=1 Tax=Neomoorella thermoacetica TaxID=1525 RepID=UPI0008FB73DC|nr:flagellar hook-associated protein FlgL [Moorella thermoacetica]OIQ60523.1 flagellar hook-associated protein 3 [Moorella thermoacetica]